MLFTQPLRLQRLTIDNGLSQNFIFCIYQDSQGFMWFGTKEGLNRYDGYRFTVYRHNPFNPNSIPDNYVTEILEDNSGMLWIGTALGGLCSFDPRREIFSRYRYDSLDANSLTSNRITSLAEDNRGNLWIGTEWGLNMLDQSRRRLTRFLHSPTDPSSISNNNIRKVVKDSSGTLWVATASGINIFHNSSQTFSRFYHVPGNSNTISSNDVYSICVTKNGSVWFGLGRSLEVFQSGRFVRHDLPGDPKLPHNVTRIVEDQNGTLWFSSLGALMNFHPKEKQFNVVRTKPSVVSLFCDNTGALWFGTNGYGVERYSKRDDRFELFPEKRIEEVVFGDIISRLQSYCGKTLSYPIIHGQSFAEDSAGNVWIATLWDGIFFYDITKKSFKRFQFRPELKYNDLRRKVYFVYVGQSGKILIGTQYGVAQLHPNNGQFTYQRLYPDDYTLLGFERVSNSYDITCIYEDRFGVLWVGTPVLGLIRYDPTDGSKRYYSFRFDDSTSINTNFILSIEPDPQQPQRYLWLGTDGGGLNKFDMQSGRAEHFTEKNGLPNNVVYAVLADRSGNLWMSTNRGLCKFNPITQALHRFDVREGLQSNEFNRRESYKARDGKIYFGGIYGVNAFYPENIVINTHIPPVVITDCKIFNRSLSLGDEEAILRQTITFTDTMIVNYRDNILSFEFAALDFSTPWKNKYAYMLEGFNPAWIFIGTERSVTFTNLDPGEYLFRVKGSNGDGVWNEKGASLRIIVLPPYYKTWWFQAGVVILMMLAIAITVRRRFARIRREHQLQEEFSRQLLARQEQDRERIAAELHDSLGQNLLVVKNRAILGSNASGETTETKTHFDFISSIVSDTLKEVREISHNLRPYQLDRLGLTDALHATAEKVQQSSSIILHHTIDDVDQLFTKEQEINLYRIVQESLNNVIKHSQATRATLSVRRADKTVTILVEDNGRGLSDEETQQTKGFGLRGMRERVKILNGTISIRSSPDQGTTLQFEIPITNKKNAGG
jgi:signal transduction histidine kinase/ligand-binding sensor domain-containing protein